MSDNDLHHEACVILSRRPWDFVDRMFDWGHDSLKGHQPEQWQEDVLRSIQSQLAEIPDEVPWEKVIREAVSAGHGPGKSTLIAWLLLWGLATMPHARVIVTANTEPQLRTKTLPEIRKWHKLCLVGHWFTVTATAVFSANREAEKTWRADLIPWSEHRPEAFAGLHNEGKRVLILFDEASAIADSIWETTEGALTDLNTEIIFCVLGNPTRRDGYFAKIFRDMRHRWNVRYMDARDSRLTNKKLIAEWIEDNGINSNFVKVRVLGLFPDQDSDTLIPESWIRSAFDRDLQWDEDDPGVLVCDVARFGEDQTVIGYRRGPVYRELESYNGKDLMRTADILYSYWYDGQKEDAEMPVQHVVIDDTGLGGGVTDRLEQQEVNVQPFLGGENALDNSRFRNRRDEGWWGIKEVFRCEEISLVDISGKDELVRQLTMLNYDHINNRTYVETKKQAKKRTKMNSPDRGDCLAMVFAPSGFEAIMAGLS